LTQTVAILPAKGGLDQLKQLDELVCLQQRQVW